MKGRLWSAEHTRLAFHLYCQLPFGRLDQRNVEVIELSELLHRTPSAVAMKLVNFASLDPAITGSGRTGLRHASLTDRKVWDEFHADWETLALSCHRIRQEMSVNPASRFETVAEGGENDDSQDFTGTTREAFVALRVKQDFFRRAVLAAYEGRCCMSNTSDPRLLIASHIISWKSDSKNRLNPQNGLCLSAIHDRAFDRHLISLTDDLCVLVGADLKQRSNERLIQNAFLAIEGHPITTPRRFRPGMEFVTHHREQFLATNSKVLAS